MSFNSKQRARLAALDALQAHIMVADTNLNITYMNPSLEALLREAEPALKAELSNFDVNTLVGRNIDVFHKNPSHQRQMLAGLTKLHKATIKIGKRQFDLSVTPLDKGGRRIGFVVEWADAKERLLNLDYSAQVAAIGRSQAMIEFTVEGVIVTANENFLKAMGYSLEEIRGKHHSIFVDPTEREGHEYAEFWRQLRSGQYQMAEYRRIGKGGKEIWIQGSYNPILDERGKVMKIVKFATDVTGRVNAVEEIGTALKQLASNNLQYRIERNFEAAFEGLRTNFHTASAELRQAMTTIAECSRTIRAGSEEIATTADDLSRRTEQQAASLEETAASLDEITATVNKTAEGAKHARNVVSTAKASAEKSGTVVRSAVEAMNGIEKSSKEIGQIIGVIDEIAFQTNLLALNAGVEAARAGDAGRGFAVVASEVRALAQRSAEAAKEIKGLISTSTEQVERGVSLVVETGAALDSIVVQVAEISEIVVAIAASAQEQALGLQQVNTAANQMDQVTQANAAAVEETSAASHSLFQETERLEKAVGAFRIGEIAAIPQRRQPKAAAPRQQAKTTRAAGSRAAAAPQRKPAPAEATAEWEEF